MKDVEHRVMELKAEFSAPMFWEDQDVPTARKIHDILTAEGYPSIHITLNNQSIPFNWFLYQQGVQWCNENVGVTRYQRVYDRLFFMRDEDAIWFKLNYC